MYRNSAFYKPNTVQIELVQGCNRQCKFCGTGGIERKIHTIEKDVLIRQCDLIRESGYNPRILLAGHGEPTLHPKFYACIKLMRKKLPGHWIQILTNGYLIHKNPQALSKMFEYGINDVSLDEYSDNKFDDAALQAVLTDLEARTGIHVDMVRMGSGVPLYAPKSAKKHRLLIIPAIDESSVGASRVLTNHCGAGGVPNERYQHRVCTRIFRELVFRWDGWVALCCQDFRGQYPIINCMDPVVTCLDDIWRHDRFEAARRILYHEKRAFFPCNICDLMPIREGLLPDHLGKETMERPTKKDWKIVSEEHPALAKPRLRAWESTLTTANNLNLKGDRT